MLGSWVCLCTASLRIRQLVYVGGNTKPATTRPASKVQFAVDVEALHTGTQATKQDQQAPIKMMSGCVWSPRIYWALRLLGKTLDEAWERLFICSPTSDQKFTITKLHSDTACYLCGQGLVVMEGFNMLLIRRHTSPSRCQLDRLLLDGISSCADRERKIKRNGRGQTQD